MPPGIDLNHFYVCLLDLLSVHVRGYVAFNNPIFTLPDKASMIRKMREVFPAPGEDMRFITKTRELSNMALRLSASISFALRISSLTFSVFIRALSPPFGFPACFLFFFSIARTVARVSLCLIIYHVGAFVRHPSAKISPDVP